MNMTSIRLALIRLGVSPAQIDAANRNVNAALTARTASETARDEALAAGSIYPTTAAGLAAVVSGKYFCIPSPVSSGYLDLYLNNAGSAVFQKRYPTLDALIAMLGGINFTAPAGGVTADGKNVLASIAADAEDGLTYELMSYLTDGSIQSGPLTAFVGALLGGVQCTVVTANDRTLIEAREGADGILYEIGGYDASGQPLTGVSTPANELMHVPLLGQSNMQGDQSYPPLSTSATNWGSYKFARGVNTWSSTDNPTTPASRAAAGFEFVDLTQTVNEGRGNALADGYKARVKKAGRYSPYNMTGTPHVLITYSGIGSRRLTDLGPVDSGANDAGNTHAAPGGYWPTMLDDVARAKAKATANGMTYTLPCWIYDQGEREGDGKIYETGSVLANSAVISGYATLALSMVQTADSAFRGIVGQSRPIPCLITPVSSNLLTTTAWMDTADASAGLAVIVGPRYMMPSAWNASSGSGGAQVWGDVIHMNPDGHRWTGEHCNKVMYRLLNDNERWQPLRVLSAAKVDAVTVDVVMNVPRPPLVIDTTLLAKVQGFGFSVYGGTIDSPTGRIYATGIAIQPDGRTVRLTFGSSIPASAKLTVGYSSVCDFGSTPTVSAVGTGANTTDGFSTYTLTVAGDITAMLKPLTDEGAFYAYGGNPSRGIIRSVVYSGGNTILTGETRELRSDAGYVPFTAGNALTFGRNCLFTNVRDSDPDASLYSFAAGPRAGQSFPLYNWLCLYDGLAVTGA